MASELQKAFSGGQNIGNNPRKDKTGDVDAALRNPLDQCLSLPGSSIKGAISTPLINWLDAQSSPRLKDAMNRDRKNGMRQKLAQMFGPITEHAMQAIKVSDVPALPSACAIFRAREQSRVPGKKGTPKPPCEALMPGCGDMWGRILLDSTGNEPAITLPNGNKVSFRKLVGVCNAFYQKRFREEVDKFYALAHFRDVRNALRSVEDRVTAMTDNSLLLRVGHYCHVESVTVEENRPFTRMGKNGSRMPFGTTRTLADGRLPFGWVLLRFCSREKYEEGLRQTEEKRRAILDAQHEQWKAVLLAKEKQSSRAARLAKEKEERRLAAEQNLAKERKKQEELARRMAELPQEEAKILKLESEPKEDLSMEIFQEMKAWTPELQQKAAQALKTCWIALGKWNGKQSKKQEAKIKAVKALLP